LGIRNLNASRYHREDWSKSLELDGKGPCGLFRIELCGPAKSHLSVIDVPGIFRTTTEGLTTEEDKSLVKRMVRRYIENPRTIILAVLAANVDIATTEILDMAEKVDPS
jgi:hypothetical protein